MLSYVVTTSRRADPASVTEASSWGERLGAPFVERRARSISALCRDEGVDGALVVSVDCPPTFLSSDGGLRYYYHPGMALSRIRNLKQGLGDPMVSAMGLDVGEAVLDCTLGRGSDAVVASFVVGPTGRVVGVESSPLIAELTIHGLQTYQAPNRALTPAFRRVQARREDHLSYLKATPDKAFDVVYFDPLFEEPVEASSAMVPLRPLADASPLTDDAIAEARRVARRCVVIKERRRAMLWKRFKARSFVGRRGSSTVYGILEAT